MRFAFLMALTDCATYGVVPPAPLAAGVRPIGLRTEKSGLWLSAAGEDGAVGRVFAEGAAALATVAGPEKGVLAWAEGGGPWTFAAGPYDFREVIFAGGHIYARGAARIWHSEDGGGSWASSPVVSSDDRLDTMALGAGGVLYTAGRSQLYLSADGARTWKALSLQLPPQPAWRARGTRPGPPPPRGVYLSPRSEPPGDR